MKAFQFLASASALLSLSLASSWSDARDQSVHDSNGIEGVMGQAGSSTSPASLKHVHRAAAPVTITPAPSKSRATTSHRTASQSDTEKSSKHSSKSTSVTSVPWSVPPGSVVMVSPASTTTAAYYKVQSTLTWVWNYTRVEVMPHAIDILATVTPIAGQPAPSAFTIATNVSVTQPQSFTWDSNQYALSVSSLPVGTYTLLIYDAAMPGYTATAAPGHLEPFNQFQFGMYTGQPRVDLANQYVCATCNAASGLLLDKQVLRAVFGMAGLTVATFMWFAGEWGVF